MATLRVRRACRADRALDYVSARREGDRSLQHEQLAQSGIIIREARPRDLDAIARLENESFEDRPGFAALVARIPAGAPSAGDRGDHRR